MIIALLLSRRAVIGVDEDTLTRYAGHTYSITELFQICVAFGKHLCLSTESAP